jgi:hypothetical protein
MACRVVAIALGCLGVGGCSEDGPNVSDDASATTTQAADAADSGPADAVHSGPAFAVGQAGEDRELYLYRMPVPPMGARGTVVYFHPEPGPIVIQVTGEQPAGGQLTICSTGVETGGMSDRLADPCVAGDPGGTTSVNLRPADGDTHVGMELAGTWLEGTLLRQLVVTYTPVDDFLAVTFADRQ